VLDQNLKQMERTPEHKDNEQEGDPDLERLLGKSSLETKLALMKDHVRLVQLLLEEHMSREVEEKAGPRYAHDGEERSHHRWGTNPGSVKVGDRRFKVDVPRLKKKRPEEGQRRFESPEIYGRMQELKGADDRLLKIIANGLSTRDYKHVADGLHEEVFGMSKSSVSRQFQERSERALERFENRDLSAHRFVALFIDGKYMQKEQVMIVLGVTEGGEKIPLGYTEARSEASQPMKELFDGLVGRGLDTSEGILVVVDGAPGISKAVKESFGEGAVIQRCRYHKRNNVLSYLGQKDQEAVRARFDEAMARTELKDARADLETLAKDVERMDRSAAGSLREGMDELLTLHRLGLNAIFAKTFGTTNCIESLNANVEKQLKKLKWWHHSNSLHRWMAVALEEAEHKMRRVNGYQKIPRLQRALKEQIKTAEPSP